MYLENDISFSDIVNLIGILRRNIDEFELRDKDDLVILCNLDREDRQLLLKIIEG